jgi:hypothetical protein
VGVGILLGITITVILLVRDGLSAPPIGIRFDGLHTVSNPSYPYGLFTITNRSPKAIEWDATVEAPLDPDFEWQQGLSSFRGGGRILPGATNQFQMLVAGKEGVPFRLVLVLQEPPSLPARMWMMLSEKLSVLRRLWDPRKMICSEWYRAGPDSRTP